MNISDITGQIRVVGLSLVVAFDERLAEIRIGAEVQRCLQLAVLDGQVGAVGRQEARDRGRGFLVGVL